MKKALQRRVLWRLVGAGSAFIGGQLVKTGLERGYKAARGASPPRQPWNKGTGLHSALLWTAATAVAVSVSEILFEQAARKGWKRATGKRPPQ